jgi:hypothetical protein
MGGRPPQRIGVVIGAADVSDVLAEGEGRGSWGRKVLT